MKKFLFSTLLFTFTLFSVNGQETHVFLLAGQSNMMGKAQFDEGFDYPQGTLQWGRFGANANSLVAANSPLEHWDAIPGSFGLSVQFAIDYKAANPGVTLVFIPAAKGNTGFSKINEWRVGDLLYSDAVDRVNECMAQNPTFKFKGILWHQGESDMNNIPAYYSYYDNLINSFRNDILEADETTPFICGGLMPSFINKYSHTKVQQVQNYLLNTPNRIPYTAYVENNGFVSLEDKTHANAATLRLMGERYFQKLNQAVLAVENRDEGGNPTAKFEIDLYPNPTTSLINIRSKSNTLIKKVSVYRGGKMVMNYNYNTANISLVLPQPFGLYFVHVVDSKGRKKVARVIKN